MSKPNYLNSDVILDPLQVEGIEFMIKTPKCINADEAGAGKTLQALKSVIDLGKIPLILCPAYLKENWKYEIAKFIGGDTSKFKIQTYSQTAPFDAGGTDALVIDESYYLKTPGAKRTEKVAQLILDRKYDTIYELNASPIKNRVPELYTQLWFISEPFRKAFPSYTGFCSYFCFEETTYQGHTRWGDVKRVGELKQILKPLMIRRKISGLPGKSTKKVVVSYGENSDLGKAWEAFTSGKVGRDITAKKESAVAKAPFTAKYVYDLCSVGNNPVVVFSDHPDAVDIIAADLLSCNLRVRKITGATPSFIRQSYVDELQRGEIEVLVCSLPSFFAGWTGTAANQMVFNDIPWVPEDLYQASRRIYRRGQMRHCFYHFMVGSKVDDYITELIVSKSDTIKKVIE
jgi:SWI/SNF-related matrix-associated actin-dependent regulator 1 of chromatin subfamily A